MKKKDQLNQLSTLQDASYNSRAIPLPQTIATFYQAAEDYDGERMASCFTEEATLVDEGVEYHGPAAASAHILEANRAAQVRTDILGCREKNGETIVTVRISGNFAGSPIPLDFHFSLIEEKINTLYIDLAEA